MATFLTRKCENESCASHEPNQYGKTPAPLVKVLGRDGEEVFVSCETCGHGFRTKMDNRKVHNYAHYNSSTDTWFHTPREQIAYEKKHKLEPINTLPTNKLK